MTLRAERSSMNPVRILFVLLVLAGVSGAGCVSVPKLPGDGDFEAGPGAPGVSVNLVRSEPTWGLARGCVWETTLQVYNTGDAEARNVNVRIALVDTGSGAVRDSLDIFAGTIPPGESRIIRAELDGDCLNEYTLRAAPVLL